MVFNFQKIENKNISVSPIVPKLLAYQHEIPKSHQEQGVDIEHYELREKIIVKIFTEFKTRQPILAFLTKREKGTITMMSGCTKKRNVLIEKNTYTKLRNVYKSILANTCIISDFHDYLIESLFIIEKQIKRNTEYIVSLYFSFQILLRDNHDKSLFLCEYIVDKLGEMLTGEHQAVWMDEHPHLYHEQNLLKLTGSTIRPFKHQMDFMNLLKLKDCNKTKKIVINASPIGTGKSILQTAFCLDVHRSNANKPYASRGILLITCENKFVLEEIARGCNVENKIAYWFAYRHQIVPSLFCHPRMKKGGRHKIIAKPTTLKDDIDAQYKYYLQKHKDIEKQRSDFLSPFLLPDVIFCLPEEALYILENTIEVKEKIISVVVDEFLIPGQVHAKTLLKILDSIATMGRCKMLCMLSASAPSTISKFADRYPDIYTSLISYSGPESIVYQYECKLPSFIRFHDVENVKKTWLPTNMLTPSQFRKDVKTFNWYHLRFYSPSVIRDMVSMLPNPEEYKLGSSGSVSFMSIQDMLNEATRVLEKIAENESDEVVEKICRYAPAPLAIRHKPKQKWMIVSEDPLSTLKKSFEKDEAVVNLHLHELISRLEIEMRADQTETDAIRKQLDSFANSKKGGVDQDLKYEKEQLMEDINDRVCTSDNNRFLKVKSGINKISLQDVRSLQRELSEFFDEDMCNKIIIMMMKGHVLILEFAKRYFAIWNDADFVVKVLYVTPLECFGTDLQLHGVKVLEKNIDNVTLIQAFGRAGRSRLEIEVPVYGCTCAVESLMNYNG